jgi:fibronectin-binding autotransporter adhesin
MVRFIIGGRFGNRNVSSRLGRSVPAVFLAACAALALALVPAASARASTFSWTKASSSDWNNAANWSGGAVPGATGTGDYVFFGLAPTSGTITSTLDISPTVGALVYNNTFGTSYWAISSSASNGPYSITMNNNTGGSINPWGDTTAAIVSTSRGHFDIFSNIVMTGDLYAGTEGTSQTSMIIAGNITSSSASPQTLHFRTSINGTGGFGDVLSTGSIGANGSTINILEDLDTGNTNCYVELYGPLGPSVGSVTMSASSGLMVISNSANTYTGPTNITAGSLQIGSGGSGETLASLSIGDSGALIFSHTDSFTYPGTISGPGSLIKKGSGNLLLTASNTYTGGTNISAGTLTIDTTVGNITLSGPITGTGALAKINANALVLTSPASNYSGNITVSGGTLQLGDGTANIGALASNIGTASGTVVLLNIPSSDTVPYGNAVSGSGSVVVNGPGTLVVTGTNNSFSGGATLSGAVVQLGDGGINNGSLPGPVTNNGSMVFENPQPQTFSGSIGGGGSVSVSSLNAAPLTLSGNNTFSGGVTLSSGAYLNVNSNTALGTGTLTINGGIIDSSAAGVALGNVPQAWNNDFTFGGSNNLNLGTGAVLLGSNRTITLNGGVLTVNGPISDGGAGYSLSITSPSGTGVLALGGTSNYSGGTNVNSGALVVNGALTGSGGVMVQSGGTLAGTGSALGGGVTLNGGATLSPGPSPFPGSIGTFTASSLSVGSGAAINFDLATTTGGTGNDTVAVTGNLSLPSGSVTIDVNPTGGSLSQNASYTLFTYGSLTNTSSSLVYSGPLGARQTETINYGTGMNSSITLSISGYFANLVWTGTGGNVSGSQTWDQNDTGNLAWTSSQHPNSDYFAALDNVRFDATASPGNQTVNLSGALQPSSVLVTGAKNYIFTNGGQITGPTALTVAGPGSLTIQNAGNSYTGGTNIQGGSIILGVPNGLPTGGTVTFGAATSNGTLDLAGNNQAVGALAIAPSANAAHQIITSSTGFATLTFVATGSTTFGGTLNDSAPAGLLALEVSSGQLVLSGANNTYAGGTTVDGGTLQLGVSNALPTAGNITAFAGGTLDLGGNAQTTSGTVSFQGGTVQNGTLTSTAVFTATSGTVTANLAGPAALNMSGGGTLVVGGPGSTYTGGTSIPGGILQLGSANALPTGGNITVYSGGTFDLGGVSQSTSGVVSVQGGVIQDGTLNVTGAAIDGESGSITANVTGSAGLHMSTSAGMLTLGGSNTYTGNTTVNGGVLQLGSSTGVPGGAAAGTVILNGGASSAGTVDINGFSADFGGLSGAAGAVPGMIVNNGASGGTLTVGDNNASTTFSGTLADGFNPLGLKKAGSGTLTLAGSNTYSGNTSVTNGILVATNSAALGNPTATTNLTVNASGELQLLAGVALNVGNVSVGGSGVTGFGAINGGTLNVTGNTISMNATSGTTVIASATALNPSSGSTLINAANSNQTLLFSGPMNAPGNVFASGSGNYVFGGGAMSISGTLQDGIYPQGRLAVISVLPGTTLNCGYFGTPVYSTLTVGGTMNTGSVYSANSTSGNFFLNGNGVLNATTFLGSGGGVIEFSNGVLNVTGSAAIGPVGPAILSGTPRSGSTFQQDSGTVNITGTGDGFTIGSEAASGNGAYTQLGGVLNVPNEYVELCYSTGPAATSNFQVLGSAGTMATANIYGVSLGQTVNNGVQNGNGTVELGNAGSLLVIGSGGIVSASSGSIQVILGTGTGGGTLASSAPWSTTVPLTLGGLLPTSIDASAGTISLDGTLSGGGGLKEIGSGLLVLGGTNTYTGGTTVASGELMATSNEAIEDGTNVFVGSDLGAFGTVVPSSTGLPTAGGTSPVPEPGTTALVAAAGAAALVLRRRRRR